ncbi:alginate lyase family protein [uncultured Akkermansia sp.]|uniref:alginate lyase family protein n=1 Tax=uncultured Akkermansia sp. TaxID=512294 RepID=UPI00260E64E2|nr:alginate lyase family protein [uncultured Akkermansia sp.]
MAHLAERMGDKNYRYRKTAAGASIQKAVDYLLPYRANPETWPRQNSGANTPLPAIFEPAQTGGTQRKRS